VSIYQRLHAVIPQKFESDSLDVSYRAIVELESTIEINLAGYVDSYNAHEFQLALQRALDSGYSNLIIVADHLTYMSSIGSTTALWKNIILKAGVAFVGLQQPVHEYLRETNLLVFAPPFPSIEQAIDHFRDRSNTT
jgi:anti-anti-sigma factor